MVMLLGLQTGFGGTHGLDVMQEIRRRGYRMVRLDAQDCTVEDMQRMIDEATNAALLSYITIADVDRVQHIPTGIRARVEYLNETDIGLGRPAPLPAKEYADGFKRAKEAAARHGFPLYGPTVANIARRGGYRYLEQVVEACDGEFIGDGLSVHVYPSNNWLRNPDYTVAPKGWGSWNEAAAAIKAVAGHKPFGISEGGFPTAFYREWGVKNTRISEDMACREITSAVNFWRAQGAEFWIQYQFNDGQTLEPIDQFGIRTADGTRWKQTADIGHLDTGASMQSALLGVQENDLVPVDGAQFAARWKPDDPTIIHRDPSGAAATRPVDRPTYLSIQPNGDYETREIIGAWETAERRANKLVYSVAGSTRVVIIV